MGGSDAIELPAHLATYPWQPQETADATHGVEIADRDEIMEAGSRQSVPTAGRIIRVGSRVFGDPLAIPAERDVQLVGVRRAGAELRRRAEEKRAARMAQLEDAGGAEFGGESHRGVGARGDRSEQEKSRLVPRTRRQAFALEERERCADGRAEILEGTTAQRQDIRSVIGAVARDGAVRFHQRDQEVGSGGGLGSHGFGQSVAHGTLHDLGPGQQLEEQPMVVRRVLAEAAIGTDQFRALLREGRHAIAVPKRGAGKSGPERGGGLQADGLRDAVVVLLRERVIQMEGDTSAGGVGETGRKRQPRVGRRRVIAKGLEGERDRDQPNGGFLAAHPIRAAVRRVARHPILERRPEELDVAFVAVPKPGTDERIGPRETGEFPDALDVIGTGIAEAGPVGVRVGGMAGQDAAGPAIGAPYFDEAIGKDAGVTAGEGRGFGDRRVACFDGPRFELRGQVAPVEVSDRQTRRGLTPNGGVEARREIFPRAHRRTPFPRAEPALARPADATGEPARTEVMEEGEKH